MNNTIYSKTLIFASQPGGPVRLNITQENNGYGIWLESDESTDLIGWRRARDEAIEVGVEVARFPLDVLRGFGRDLKSFSL